MSMRNEPGTQSNPEQERGVNGDGAAVSHADLSLPVNPLAVKVDEAQDEQDQSRVDEDDARQPDAGRAAHGVNGVNGTHSTSVEETALDGQADEAEAAADASPIAADESAPVALEISTPRSAVKIKGRPGGVSLELGDGDWDELMLLLTERLNAAEGFFRGGRVLLEVGARALDEAQLRQVRELLETHEMQLAVVRSTADATLQAAFEVGISTTIEETHESLPVAEPPLFVDEGPPNAYTPSVYAPPPEVVSNRPNHFVYRGSLRSGQVLRKTESIVVIGDINPGAQVVSGGDVMVWGRLRGIAHAGAEGNRRAVVAAIDFVPTQLRIANLTAIAPERTKPRRNGLLFWKKEPERGPEIARVIDGRIVVEPWDEGKPNGLGMWRAK